MQRNSYDKLVQVITATPATKQTIIRNQFGGNLGGPVYIPKLFPGLKDRVFFFANYEKMLEHDGNSLITGSVPSAAERTGNYSELLVNNPDPQQLFNPFETTYDANGNSTRPAIPNNRLDLARKPDGSPLIDPTAVKLVNATIPLPNVNVPSNETNYVGYQAKASHNTTLIAVLTRGLRPMIPYLSPGRNPMDHRITAAARSRLNSTHSPQRTSLTL